MLNQNDKSLVIFLGLQGIATIQDYRALLLCASEKIFWHLFNLKKAFFFCFAILPCCKSRKKAFT